MYIYRGQRFDGVMASVLESGKTKDNKIGVYCFSDKNAALRRNSKDWLPWDQENVSQWSDIFTCVL